MLRSSLARVVQCSALGLVAMAFIVSGCNTTSSSTPAASAAGAGGTGGTGGTGGGTGGTGGSTATPAPVTTTFPYATATAIPLPSLAAGYGGSITFPSGGTIPAGTTVTVTVQLAAPAGYATPAPTSSPAGTATAVSYALIKFNTPTAGTFALGGSPTQVFTLPSIVAGKSYYVNFEDLTTPNPAQIGYGSPGTISGTTITFVPQGGGGASIIGNDQYAQGLVYF